MREIATVLGKLDEDKVVDTEIPQDLVHFLPVEPGHYLSFFPAYNHHVEVQRRFPLPGCLSPSAYDGCPCRVAFEEGS